MCKAFATTHGWEGTGRATSTSSLQQQGASAPSHTRICRTPIHLLVKMTYLQMERTGYVPEPLLQDSIQDDEDCRCTNSLSFPPSLQLPLPSSPQGPTLEDRHDGEVRRISGSEVLA